MEQRSGDRESFTAWATARRSRLVRTATFLTGDRGRAKVLDPGRTPRGDTGVERQILLLDALRRPTERQRAVLVLLSLESS